MSSRANLSTVRVIVGTAVPLLVSGCSPTAPSPSQSRATSTSPPVQAGPSVLGLVTESGRPVVGANVNAWVGGASGGYSYMYLHGPVLTDEGGHYQLTFLSPDSHAWLQAWKDGYIQQCAITAGTLQDGATADIALVLRANLTAVPPMSAPGSRSVTGTIVEMTSAGTRPVAGAFVDFEPIEDFPAAVTYSDGNGRFALCGLPENATARLSAASNSRVAYSDLPPGQADITITLPQ